MNLLGKIMVWIISSGIISYGSAQTAIRHLSLKREFDREKRIRDQEEEALRRAAEQRKEARR